MVMFAYVLIAVIAAIAGYAQLMRMGMAFPNMPSPRLEVHLIVIFAAVQSSKLLKNNIIALGYGLLVSIILIMSEYIVWLLDMPFVVNDIVAFGLALQQICIACAANGGWRSLLKVNLESVEDVC